MRNAEFNRRSVREVACAAGKAGATNAKRGGQAINRAALIAAMSLALPGGQARAGEAYVPPPADSVLINFNPAWRLMKGNHPVDGTDDSAWEQVAMPHTYGENIGPYTYRKHFTIPGAYRGRRLFLEFQGVRQRGQFYLNGRLLGRHSNGVTPIGFDITPHVTFDADNILHVETDLESREFETDCSMPWTTGFNPVYGGIPRNVVLHVFPEVHATLPLYTFLGTEGTYIYARDISTEQRSAQIGIEVQVANAAADKRSVDCQAVLVDREGREAARFAGRTAEVHAGARQAFKLRGRVSGLHFWQPGYPYLYDVYTIVKAGGGKPDVRRHTTGFRKIEVRGNTFYLNNRVLMTHGYTPRAQNGWMIVGNAYPDWLHDYSNALMVEGVSTLVRWMHVMPSPQDLASCDRVGLPQMVTGADREQGAKGREHELRKEIMRNVIIYARNHPSIILWEANNSGLSPEQQVEFVALRERWDSGGYRRLMGGRPGPEWVAAMFGVHKEKDRLSIDVEYMRDESPRRWWDAWSPPYFHKGALNGGVENPRGQYLDREVAENRGFDRNQDNMCRTQSVVYEKYFKARPGTGEEICNGGVQILFADSTCFHRGSDPFRRSGGVDGMRIPKDAFFCNQTMRSNTAELWTAGRFSIFLPGHWNYPEGTVKPMYVFVSPGIERVELKVNGTSIPGGQRSNTFLFTFPDVTWKVGRVEAIGFDVGGKEVARTAHSTCGEPAALRMKVMQGPGGLRADGSDVALIETETVDKEGRRCPIAQNLVKYEVTGPGLWLGGFCEKGRGSKSRELPVVNGIHRVFVRSTEQPGTIKVSASAEGLPAVSIEVIARQVTIAGGLTLEMPAVLPAVLKDAPRYGPDLPPPPEGKWAKRYPPKTAQADRKANGEWIRDLSAGFPHGATIAKAKDGAAVYADESWKFQGLPARLAGAEYLLVRNVDAAAMIGEALMFKMGGPGQVFVAYDDRNRTFPALGCAVKFRKTEERLVIAGHPHTVWESEALKEGDTMYLGSNNWPEQPPEEANNMVVFVAPEGRQAPAAP